MSGELERAAVDALADRWRAGWQGKGFEACCTPDVSYEDPVAVNLLRGVDELDAHALTLRQAFPDLSDRADRAAAHARRRTSACPGGRSALIAATSATCFRRRIAS